IKFLEVPLFFVVERRRNGKVPQRLERIRDGYAVPDTLAPISKEEREIVERKRRNAVALRFRCEPTQVVRNPVRTGHAITNREIIERTCTPLTLEGIQVRHVQTDVG